MIDNAIVVQTESRFLSPAATIQEALARYAIVGEFASRVLKENQDYGVIPGTSKPTLLKPGAEKLSSLFGLSPAFSIAEKDLDWTGEKHGGEPFFYFQYLCTMYAGERIIAQGVGSCNNWEKKYRYRQSDRLCPKCGKSTIIKGREEYGGGWLCFAKKGGCGAKFKDGDKSIEGQETGQVKNPDPADNVNTIDKMAQKRALIAATLIATNASEYFTQDLDDFYPGTFTDAPTPAPAVTTIRRDKDAIPEPAYDLPDQDAEMPTGPGAIAQNVPPMTLTEAQNIENRDHVRYGDIDSDKLVHMANALARKSNRNALEESKLLACQLILQARAAEAVNGDG